MSNYPTDWKFQRYVIDNCLNMYSLLKKAGFHLNVSGSCLCPFHEDSQPSAKFYQREDGVYQLFCFAEHRLFLASDVVYQLLGWDTKEAFEQVWDSLSTVRRQELEMSFAEPVSAAPATFLSFSTHISPEWRSHNLKFHDLLDRLVEVIEVR